MFHDPVWTSRISAFFLPYARTLHRVEMGRIFDRLVREFNAFEVHGQFANLEGLAISPLNNERHDVFATDALFGI